jgi:dolichol-phosphate mannosyltransferase
MAYVIRLWTSILGTNEYGVRAGAVLSALVASIFVYLLAKRTLGERVALVTVVLANIVPLFAAGALIMTQDPVQLALWPATLYVVWLALERPPLPSQNEGGAGTWPLWLLAGVLAGLTTMAKLNGILVLAGSPCSSSRRSSGGTIPI